MVINTAKEVIKLGSIGAAIFGYYVLFNTHILDMLNTFGFWSLTLPQWGFAFLMVFWFLTVIFDLISGAMPISDALKTAQTIINQIPLSSTQTGTMGVTTENRRRLKAKKHASTSDKKGSNKNSDNTEPYPSAERLFISIFGQIGTIGALTGNVSDTTSMITSSNQNPTGLVAPSALSIKPGQPMLPSEFIPENAVNKQTLKWLLILAAIVLGITGIAYLLRTYFPQLTYGSL